MTATRVTGVMAVPGLAWLAWQAAAGDRPASSRRRARRRGRSAPGHRRLQRCTTTCVERHAVRLVSTRSRIGATSQAGIRSAACSRLLQALVTRPYQFLATERMAPYDTLNALAAARRAGAGAAHLAPLQSRLRAHRARRPAAAAVVGSVRRPRPLHARCSFPIALALASFAGELRHHVLLAASAMLLRAGPGDVRHGASALLDTEVRSTTGSVTTVPSHGFASSHGSFS